MCIHVSIRWKQIPIHKHAASVINTTRTGIISSKNESNDGDRDKEIQLKFPHLHW